VILAIMIRSDIYQVLMILAIMIRYDSIYLNLKKTSFL